MAQQRYISEARRPLTNRASGGNSAALTTIKKAKAPMSEEKTAPTPGQTTPDPEVIYVSARRISCDGGGGALGHPVVWYSLEDGEAECGYCDRKFIYKKDAKAE